jgi:hypothetical protein
MRATCRCARCEQNLPVLTDNFAGDHSPHPQSVWHKSSSLFITEITELQVAPQIMARIHTPTAGITMRTSPILAFIDSCINQAQLKAKIRRRNNHEKARSAVRQKTTIGSYIYAIVVDGVVRYIGKGRNGGADVRSFGRSETDLCSMPSRNGSSASADAQETRRNGQGRVSDHRDRHHIRLDRSGRLPT